MAFGEKMDLMGHVNVNEKVDQLTLNLFTTVFLRKGILIVSSIP